MSAPSGSCSSSPPSHTVFKDWNLRPPPSHSLPLLDSLTPTSLSLHLTQSVSLNHILHSTWMSLHPKPSLSQTKSVIFPHHPPHLTIILLSIQLHQANPEGPPGSTLRPPCSPLLSVSTVLCHSCPRPSYYLLSPCLHCVSLPHPSHSGTRAFSRIPFKK